MTKVLFRSVDLETEDMDPPAGVLEIGWTDLVFDTETKRSEIAAPRSLLFRNVEPMKPEVRAVHHINPDHVAHLPICTPADLLSVATDGEPKFLVAANADFEKKWISAPDGVRWVCTVKAAARLYPDAASKSNRAIHYLLGLDLPDDLAMPPHRAGPDSYVTAHILATMLRTVRVSELVSWEMQPLFLPTCPLGKHKGVPWPDVPFDYLQWIIRAPDMKPEVVHAANLEMEARRSPAKGSHA